MSMHPSFTALPTEILEAIFLHLDPQSFVYASRTCKAIHVIANDAPAVWRHFCRTRFRSWSGRHNLSAKIAGPLSDVNWRWIFVQRMYTEKETLRVLNQLLESQQGRIQSITQIADFGYDARDVLLQERSCPDDVEDVLARRYYANAVLERIQREEVLTLWKDMADGKEAPLEQALGAYDVFSLTGPEIGFDTTSHHLDVLAGKVLKQFPTFKEESTRFKASTLASFLRDEGFKGVSDVSYGALRNSFIGLALRTPEHQSLPLISVAIYCALASRLALDARPCGFLFHVYCIAYAPKDYTVDNVYKPTSSSDLERMYLDPFRSSEEVPQSELQQQLRNYGVPSVQHERYLSFASTREMVVRTARNIINSVQTIRETERGMFGIHDSWLNAYPDMDSAFYATIWAMLLLGPGDEEGSEISSVSSRRRQYLPYLLEHFQTHFPWDVTLLAQHVIPLFAHQPEFERLVAFVNAMQTGDDVPKRQKTRSPSTSDEVEFKVGQLFKHKRYNYEGVITGWDFTCEAGEEWIQHMQVDRLHGGRRQPFYHVLVCDKSIRYVAAENIEIVPRSVKPSEAMLRIAGRHFKRWDDESNVFVSNIQDEYPDD